MGARPFSGDSLIQVLSRMQSLHPATHLIAWLTLLIGVQCLRGPALLLVCLVAPVAILLAGKQAMHRSARLVWRARWLLLSLLLVFSWGVAGEPLWEGRLAPTHEGLHQGLLHLGRLWLVLIVVAAFLTFMPLANLLTATHSLLSPLRGCGLDSDRGVVRLMLVLRYVEALPRPRDWRSLLEIQEVATNEVIEIDHPALRLVDLGVMLTLVGGLIFFCLR